MEEKDRKLEERNTPIPNTKLTWEAPKLYALDKGKTEGGPLVETAEDSYYNS
ncbi:MAG TPA: hypothetical protein VK982_16040 [Bacteroidales bacterium]|nr:hypothetical protein [Bacteroidales bacterium]